MIADRWVVDEKDQSTCAISVIRIQFLNLGDDPTYDNVSAAGWSIGELCSAIVCASLPTLRPIFSRVVPASRHLARSLAQKACQARNFGVTRMLYGGSRYRRRGPDDLTGKEEDAMSRSSSSSQRPGGKIVEDKKERPRLGDLELGGSSFVSLARTVGIAVPPESPGESVMGLESARRGMAAAAVGTASEQHLGLQQGTFMTIRAETVSGASSPRESLSGIQVRKDVVQETVRLNVGNE
jgi:hypothetical protein